MDRLASRAIYSDESRKVLEDMWMDVAESLTSNTPRQEDQDLLSVILKNHITLANMMMKSESLQANLVNDAHQILLGDDTCE
jgi:hypothetical protein